MAKKEIVEAVEEVVAEEAPAIVADFGREDLNHMRDVVNELAKKK